MNYQKTCDKVIDNALLFGELISFTAWKRNYEEYRRPINVFQDIFSKNPNKLTKITEAIKTGKNYMFSQEEIKRFEGDNRFWEALLFDESTPDMLKNIRRNTA